MDATWSSVTWPDPSQSPQVWPRPRRSRQVPRPPQTGQPTRSQTGTAAILLHNTLCRQPIVQPGTFRTCILRCFERSVGASASFGRTPVSRKRRWQNAPTSIAIPWAISSAENATST